MALPLLATSVRRVFVFFFVVFFQAEAGIRDVAVTGVQTCALPIYKPLTVMQMTALLGEVKAIARLPDELRVGDLRKTAIVQMIDSGVDHLAIQSVSGHKNVSSLNPYRSEERRGGKEGR